MLANLKCVKPMVCRRIDEILYRYRSYAVVKINGGFYYGEYED